METVFVYKGSVVGNGILHNTPSTGDYIKIPGGIFKIEAVMFNFNVNNVNCKVSAVLYLKDVMSETEEKLKYC